MRRIASAVLLTALVLLPALSSAQSASGRATLTGVVKDASGGVLPGVTVEATSASLIEKARQQVTDAAGRYRIVDLPAGAYALTFTLPGFSTVKRDAIQLEGAFTAAINVENGGRPGERSRDRQRPDADCRHSKCVAGNRHQPRRADAASDRTRLVQCGRAGAPNGHDRDAGHRRPHRHTRHRDEFLGQRRAGYRRPVAGGRPVHRRQPHQRHRIGCLPAGHHQRTGSDHHRVRRPRGGRSRRSDHQRDSPLGGQHSAGSFYYNFSNDALQGNNINDDLKAQNPALASAAGSILKTQDINVAYGGPIKRDRIWYFGGLRHTILDKGIQSFFYNKNQGVNIASGTLNGIRFNVPAPYSPT